MSLSARAARLAFAAPRPGSLYEQREPSCSAACHARAELEAVMAGQVVTSETDEMDETGETNAAQAESLFSRHPHCSDAHAIAADLVVLADLADLADLAVPVVRARGRRAGRPGLRGAHRYGAFSACHSAAYSLPVLFYAWPGRISP